MSQGEVAERNFPSWTMGFRDKKGEELVQFQGFADLGSTDFWNRAESGRLNRALELMKSFHEDDI